MCENCEKLERALERACEYIANRPGTCPVCCVDFAPWECGDETCIKKLIQYFKEAQNE